MYTSSSSSEFLEIMKVPQACIALLILFPWSAVGLAVLSTSTERFSTNLHSVESVENTPHVPNVLFVECGFGNDSHGQNATKAAKRACRNAIEFNTISIKTIVPGGYDAMKLNVILAVPEKYHHTLDLDEVAKTFPYGEVKFEVQAGGMLAPSGRVIESLGDKNDDMLIVCAAVQVGY